MKKNLKVQNLILLVPMALIGYAGYILYQFGTDRECLNELTVHPARWILLLATLFAWKIYQNKFEGLLQSLVVTLWYVSGLVVFLHHVTVEISVASLALGIVLTFIITSRRAIIWVVATLCFSVLGIWLGTGTYSDAFILGFAPLLGTLIGAAPLKTLGTD